MRSARFVAVLAFLTHGALAAVPEFPNKPIRYIVATGPGGASDLIGRTLGPALSEMLGVQVVIDNRTGAGNTVGAEIAARAAPDGYTLFSCNIASLAVGPALYKKLGYDPERDFAPIGMIVSNPNVLTVHPSLPARSIAQFIALAKANPGKLDYGSSGIGGAGHLAMALFASMAGIEMTHVPYKGGAPAVVDLVAGRLSLMMANLTTAKPHIRAGRLRGLGVGTRARSPLFPDLPTIAESGLPGYEANNWNGVVAPAGTPKPLVAKLNHAIVAILKEPQTAERLTAAGLEPIGDSPDEFGRYLKSEAVKWQKLVKSMGLTAN